MAVQKSTQDSGQSSGAVDYYDEWQCKQYLATFLALLSAFTCGHATSLSLVFDPELILDLPRYEPRQFYLAMALYFVIGQIAGASIAKVLCQNWGPKKALTAGSVSFLLSWLFVLQHLLLINSILWIRFLNGFSAGLVAVALLTYLCDISLPTNRGFILISFTTASLLGTYLPMLFCLKSPYLYSTIVLGINLSGILVLFLLPESPVWLLRTSNDPRDLFAAEKALRLIRSSSSDCATLFEINRLVGEKDQSWRVLLDHPLFSKPLRLSLLLALLQQSTYFSVFYLFGRPLPHLLDYFDSLNKTKTKDLLAVRRDEAALVAIIQLSTLLVVLYVLVKFLERRTILVACGCAITLLNVAQGILVHAKIGQYNTALRVLIYITSAVAAVVESVVWLTVVEMPLHEHRVYTTMCAFVSEKLVTSMVLGLLQFGQRAYMYFVSSFLLVAITALLFMRLPSTHNCTTGQIMRQFLKS